MAKGAKSGSRYNKTDAEMEALVIQDTGKEDLSDEGGLRLDAMRARKGKNAPKAYAKGGKYGTHGLGRLPQSPQQAD